MASAPEGGLDRSSAGVARRRAAFRWGGAGTTLAGISVTTNWTLAHWVVETDERRVSSSREVPQELYFALEGSVSRAVSRRGEAVDLPEGDGWSFSVDTVVDRDRLHSRRPRGGSRVRAAEPDPGFAGGCLYSLRPRGGGPPVRCYLAWTEGGEAAIAPRILPPERKPGNPPRPWLAVRRGALGREAPFWLGNAERWLAFALLRSPWLVSRCCSTCGPDCQMDVECAECGKGRTCWTAYAFRHPGPGFEHPDSDGCRCEWYGNALWRSSKNTGRGHHAGFAGAWNGEW